MKLKITQIIGWCIFFVCQNDTAMQPVKRLATVHSGIHCVHKLVPAVHGPQMKMCAKKNVLKLGASLSTLALTCHISSHIPAHKK